MKPLRNKTGLELDELRDLVKAANLKLLKAREERIRPGLDDKSNCLECIDHHWSWRCYAAFGQQGNISTWPYKTDFIWSNLWNGKMLFRNFKDGKGKYSSLQKTMPY